MGRLFAKYHMAKVCTATPPVKIAQQPGTIAAERISKLQAVQDGGTGYKKNDAEHRKRTNRRTAWVKVKKYKAGRNEKCPCGSGIKFKKCCIEVTK